MNRMAILFCSVLLAACFRVVVGSGDIVSDERRVSGFDAVDVCCGWEVWVTQGDEESLVLRGDDNILDHIDSEVVGGRLIIDYHRAATMYDTSRRVEVRVGAVDLVSLDGSGGVDVELSDVTSPSLDIALSGGSTLGSGQLEIPRLSVDVSGGGWVELEGEADRLDLELSGGSRFGAANLQAQRLQAALSGGSTATTWVTEHIDADLSGGSVLRYFGKPTIDQESSGGSRVESLGDK